MRGFDFGFPIRALGKTNQGVKSFLDYIGTAPFRFVVSPLQG
jgi:hypothetical protein